MFNWLHLLWLKVKALRQPVPIETRGFDWYLRGEWCYFVSYSERTRVPDRTRLLLLKFQPLADLLPWRPGNDPCPRCKSMERFVLSAPGHALMACGRCGRVTRFRTEDRPGRVVAAEDGAK